ncbi:TPA: relaxase domain-containing protein, partial [Listeria monocytogenes]|nr:relaxase domain-containing protein [Listeria monocytogenes]
MLDQVLARGLAWVLLVGHGHDSYRSSRYGLHRPSDTPRLIAEYVARHGRQPSTATIIKLRAQATLATRPEKEVRSMADLTAEWRTRATGVLGHDATTWARGVMDN